MPTIRDMVSLSIISTAIKLQWAVISNVSWVVLLVDSGGGR